MSPFRVYFEQSLSRAAERWGLDAQIELEAVRNVLEKHGPVGLKINQTWTIPYSLMPIGSPPRIYFLWKFAGTWMTLSIEQWGDDTIVLRLG